MENKNKPSASPVLVLGLGSTNDRWKKDIEFAINNKCVDEIFLDFVDANRDFELLETLFQSLVKKENVSSSRDWKRWEIRHLELGKAAKVPGVLNHLFPIMFQHVCIHDMEIPFKFWYTVGAGLNNPKTKIEKLSFWEINPKFDNRSIKEFQRGLKSNKRYGASTLKEITFGMCHFTASSIGNLGKSLSSLTHLSSITFMYCDLDDDKINSFLCKDNMLLLCSNNVTRLDLTGNQCRSKGFQSLANLITSSQCKLTHLNLASQFPYFDNGNGNNNGIDELDLSLLVQGLARNSTLRQVVLSKNNLTDDVAVLLGPVLATHVSLQQIDLSHNNFTDQGASTFATCLKRSVAFCYMNLDENPQIKNWNIFLPTVQQNHNIGTLAPQSLAGAQAYKKYSKLNYYLDINRGGRKMFKQSTSFLNNNKNNGAIWPIILERVQHLKFLGPKKMEKIRQASILYSLLRDGGILFVYH